MLHLIQYAERPLGEIPPRQAEIKHGRLAMWAALAWPLAEACAAAKCGLFESED